MTRNLRATSLFLGLALLTPAAPALAHSERQIASPIRPGPVPDIDRRNPHVMVVCKASSKPTKAEHKDIHYRLRTTTGDALAQAQAEEAAWHRNSKLFKKCRFEHIQEAANAASDDTDIFLLPGVYREEPSRAAPTSCNTCGDNSDGTFSYEYHVTHPNDQSLIFLSKKNITIEGTGIHPEDVLIDVGFVKDVGVRCDRCTGFIIRNLWQRDANEHGIYVVDSDGYIFDRTRGSYNKEYSLFSFASDNGLYTDCDAEGGGDSGLYIGGQPDTHLLGRFAAEVRRCKMHHSALGFSGTQGSSIWMHDNDVYDNAIGLSYDSENDHPNFPERWSVIENNLLHDNNFDIYAPTSDVPARGPAYDFFRYPVGTGMWIVGGTDNVIRNNIVWNNIRFGFILARNPLEAPLPSTVDRNSFTGNRMGVDPAGNPAPNSTAFPPGGAYAPGGSDFTWDETGMGNCWGPHDAANPNPKTDPPNALNPLAMPGPCPTGNVAQGSGAPLHLGLLINCSMDTSQNPPVTTDATYPCPWGHTNDAPYLNGDEQECGNGVIDLGEDCDEDAYNPGAIVPAETCDSLGHGPGTLGCVTTPRACTWDTSGCTAPTCTEYGASTVRLRNVLGPAGDDELVFTARDIPGAAFDPTTQDLSFVFRDDQGLVVNALVPSGSAGWTSSATEIAYADPAGTFGGVTSVSLRGTPAFGTAFRATVRIRTSLAAAADARTGTAVLRIGDDCWSDTTPCSPAGSNVTCKGRAQP
jgi:hypothetical protein